MVERARIGLRQIKALKPGQTVWDAAVAGFGARRQKSNAIAYVLYYRTGEGRQRWYTIGRHGAPWTPDTARTEAKRVLGLVAKGDDPAADKLAKRKAETVSELCDLYMADAEAGRVLKRKGGPKKASTLAIDRGRVERHIKPLIGRLKVSAVTQLDCQNLLYDVAAGKTAATIKTKNRGLARVRGGKGTANRVVRLLGGIFTYALKKGMRSDNPVGGVEQYADGERKRRLSDDEYRVLGVALRKAEEQNVWPAAIAAVRFLAVAGWRSGEVLSLKWPDIDFRRRTAFLGDTKTGKSVRPLSNVACDTLRELKKTDGLVFPATRGSGEIQMTGFKKLFNKSSNSVTCHPV